MEAESAFTFELPSDRNAGAPPERRGLRRDRVRLLVQNRADGTVNHSSFHRLADFLRPGDCLVLNESRTIPASLQARRFSGELFLGSLEVRLARRNGESAWDALLLRPDERKGMPSAAEASSGDMLRFSPSLHADVELCPSSPFVTLKFNREGNELMGEIYALGEPVRYEYSEKPWELDYYQTVYGTVPGSVEMPSAGRAFTWEMMFSLQQRHIRIAYVQLHTSLSYLYGSRLDPAHNAEYYAVSARAADTINEAKRDGGRIIAVGTTVVRCLESAAAGDGFVRPGSDCTRLYIDETVPLRVADGLISGLHEPEASHLHMLSAFVGISSLRYAYDEAIREHYLWHEFGDVHLIL
ncbi:S-adenosylmethionine:tRNA ribosyltransferase-isomerase [Paenibacillus mesophilus]|uniref:S-adenosylmethionine:tRNA ribosyltransferase-isomerase n=1 Tax=Paenibacillus mesophilus TaxID=2582849 RepID=UPI00110D87BD|nr:S-adenosylmethionine:tRNA ribosyltransferase-isomerase [Paenibacillus mesophilus]TMV45971.1 S-adenosylmethionine:tRNA ribosyltransferase-isomerase [Paenibacillus mesophilus]